MSGMSDLRKELRVINIGSSHFFEELKRQGIKAVHVNWRPQVELEEDIQRILGEVL